MIEMMNRDTGAVNQRWDIILVNGACFELTRRGSRSVQAVLANLAAEAAKNNGFVALGDDYDGAVAFAQIVSIA